MRGHDRDIGMDRGITRRDFLNGVGVALTSALVAPAWLEAWGVSDAQSPESAPDYYPPARTGMRGSHPGSFEIGHQLRDAKAWRAAATDTGETLRSRGRRRRDQRPCGRAFLPGRRRSRARGF